MSVDVAAIILAFNEEATIVGVLRDVLSSKLFREVFVVDDGSTDQTPHYLKQFDGIQVVTNPLNLGKGKSVAKVLPGVESQIVVLLDADFVGYSRDDLFALIDPVLRGVADYTLRKSDVRLFRRLAGVRCHKKSDLDALVGGMNKTTRYGLELFLAKHFSHKYCQIVPFKKSHHLIKTNKRSLLRALGEYLEEGMSLLGQIVQF